MSKKTEPQIIKDINRYREQYKQNMLSQDYSVVNPAFGVNPFEPESYLPRLPSDPSLVDVLPSGRYFDPRFPTEQATIRTEQLEEFYANPQEYIQKNAQGLTEEQSLLDRGKGLLARVFDYRDEADLEMFGFNMSAVESVWDGFLRHLIGGYDLLAIGYGGLLSAAPGGLRTLSYDELSGGRSVAEVLRGEMEWGDAPSPGQIAIASIALESKRIREGNARLADVLLLNPATAPFILAGIAADTSPLQQEGFDIMDQEQRETAFGQGWEKWMSGVTDAGLMFADPLIGLGVGIKVGRAGALGAYSGGRMTKAIEGAVSNATEEFVARTVIANPFDEINSLVARGQERVAMGAEPGAVIRNIEQTGVAPQSERLTPTVFKPDVPMPEFDNPIARFMFRALQVKDDGVTKVRSVDELARDPVMEANTLGSELASVIHQVNNVGELDLVLRYAYGSANARDTLFALRPGLADQMFQYKRQQVMAMSAYLQQPARAEAEKMLSDSIRTTRDQLDYYKGKLDEMKIGPDEVPANQVTSRELSDLQRQYAVTQQNVDELTELHRMLTRNTTPDMLDPTNPFYRKEMAERIVFDLHSATDPVTRGLNQMLYGSALSAKMALPTRSNAFSRMVQKSRERRGTARYQYQVEGTSIFPRKIARTADSVSVTYGRDGWLSPSQFDGVSPLQRNARVWRWAGRETPNGYIGLRAGATVGAEREFTAALDLQIYATKDGVQVTRPKLDSKGNQIINPKTGSVEMETFQVGGIKRRNELFEEFYAGLNDPNVDSFQVLQRVEYKVAEDLALAYGQSVEKMQVVLDTANRSRVENLKLIRDEGYFIDPIDGTKHHAPYLESQLASGTYMQNFTEMERILRHNTLVDGGAHLRRAMELPMHVVGNGLELFNNFWRPLTLMRLSYTTRNVFENMIRAMAYNASLAPLSWPVRVGYNATRNKIVERSVTRKATKAQKRLEGSEYNKYIRELDAAEAEYMSLRLAPEMTLADDVQPTVYRFVKELGKDAQYEKMGVDEYARRLTAAQNRVNAAKRALETNKRLFDEAVEKTAFGTWREKNIKALEKKIKENDKFVDILTESMGIPSARGDLMTLADNPGLVEKLFQLTALKQDDARLLDILMYQPANAMMEYRTVAGRARRIGSGQSIGPGGLLYDDAFAGPYEAINRGLLSSDGTNKQAFAVKADVFHSIWRTANINTNQPIAFTQGNRKAWVRGMADVIERDSSSRLVRFLLRTDFDQEKALQWMMTNPEGKEFLAHIRSLMGQEGSFISRLDSTVKGAPQAQVVQTPSGAKRLAAFADDAPMGQPGRTVTVTDREVARAYIADVVTKTQQQMQNHTGFFDLLKRRAREKDIGAGRSKAGAGVRTAGIKDADVEAVLARMTPDEQARLGYVQGSEIIDMGTDSMMRVWSNFTSRMMRLLGTVPEDAIARGPFYQTRYKAVRNELAESYLAGSGQLDKLSKKKARDVQGRVKELDLNHAEFTIPANELNRIYYLAHRQALRDTREYMYTIERRTNLGKYGEWIFPFISATQNAVTVTGKLIYRDPALVPFLIDLWRAPAKLGIEDDEGNLLLPMPVPWVRDFLKNNPDIPVLGGVLDSNDVLKVNKNSLNVAFPDTGYGIFQRPTPVVQVAASELMKANLFPIETPEIITAALGKEAGDDFYQEFQNYLFGERQGMSSKFASYDKITPAYIQRVFQSRDELSKQYGYQYALHWHTQTARYMSGERDDPPTEDEINKRTTNTFWFYALGNLGLPTPLTPYPILTRPNIESPVSVLSEVYQQYRLADPLGANLNFSQQFGDWALPMANTKVTRNIGGANPTAEAVQDAKDFDGLLREVSQVVGDDLTVMGIITNNRESVTNYDQNAYQYQQQQRIPGRTQDFRENVSPLEAQAEREKIAGWTVYRQFMDQLDARLAAAGLKSYEQRDALPFKQARQQFIFNMLQNPEFQGWAVDWTDRGGNRAIAAVRTIELAVADDTFRTKMIRSGKEQLVSIMDQYVYYRRGVLNELVASGKGIEHPDNIWLKESWNTMRQSWKIRDVRWAEIADLYLSGDDNPQNPGNFTGAPLEVPESLRTAGMR